MRNLKLKSIVLGSFLALAFATTANANPGCHTLEGAEGTTSVLDSACCYPGEFPLLAFKEGLALCEKRSTWQEVGPELVQLCTRRKCRRDEKTLCGKTKEECKDTYYNFYGFPEETMVDGENP